MEQYPQYFRKEGTIIRRDGPTTGVIIKLPAHGKNMPNSLDTITHDIYPTRERLDQELMNYEVSDEKKFNEFLDTYFKNASYMSSRFYQKMNQPHNPNPQI